jgi:hypothetical protein
MVALTKYLPDPAPEINNIIDMSADAVEEPVATARELPAIPIALRRALSGYEMDMRRHAAACEAGR